MKHYIRFNKESESLVKPLWGKDYAELKNMEGQVVVVNADTDDEYLLVPEEIVNSFHTLSISRDDFENYGFDASKLDDSTMEHIAYAIAESVSEYELHEYIDFWAGEYNLPQISKENDDD